MVNPEEWKATVGALLRNARTDKGLSKRKAATLAGFSEAVWRQLEEGERQIRPGVMAPANPRDETLGAAARAVGLPPEQVFDAAGRHYMATPLPEGPGHDRLSRLERRMDGLEAAVTELWDRQR